MKYFIVFSFFCFFSYAQQENIEDYKEKQKFIYLINEKPADYFEIEEMIRDSSYKNLKDFSKDCKDEFYLIGEICALNCIGRYHRNNFDYELAIKNHQNALKLCVENDYKALEATCLNFLGVVYRYDDDIRNALDHHQSAISKSRKIQPQTFISRTNISVAENSLGNIYLSIKQYEKAIEQFNRAIITQKETKNIRGLAINFQNIGEAFEKLSFYNKAMDNYKKSLAYNNQINSLFGKVTCNNSIASVLIKNEEYQKASLILDSILPFAKKINNPNQLAKAHSNLGWAQMKLKKYQSSLSNLKKALEISEISAIEKSTQIDICFHLSEYYKILDNYKRAYVFYEKAVDIEKKTLGLRNNIYVSNLITKQDLQTRINQFNDLQNETKIKSLQLAKNRNILIITLITIGLMSIVLYSMYRQHLLRNDRRVLILEQEALQSQMNPHFIFNALNSIKLYIINNEQKNAVYYLNKFSKLIRKILDVSKVREVSLREELATMSLYMSIENIRFSNGIDYIEKIDPDLNTDTIRIPPLVLQPFLENSIWHGLSSKEGQKEIVLEASRIKGDFIEINIIDNGVGREAAEKIKKKKAKSLNRESIGIKLTTERLTTFYNESTNEFSLNYTDIMDDQGKPCGTKASLRIPVS